MDRSESAITIANAKLVTPGGVRDGWIRVEGSRIATLAAGPAPTSAGEHVDAGGHWVLPGTVDMHIHGGAGAAFTDADPERAMRVVEFNRARGVTTLLGGLVSASPSDTLDQIAALAELCDSGELAGIYLEGPYIARSKCGAHDPDLLRDPDPAEFDRMVKAGRGHVRMVTLAPELPGALDLVRAAVDSGVVAAVGHTEAGYDQTRAAFDAGATVATHLYNQMRALHHRDPGPIAAALNDERVTVELINDGVHVHPGAAQVVFDAAGSDRVALITDAMSATGLPDGEYHLGGLHVTVADGRATVTDTGALASSTIMLPQAIRRAVHHVRGVDIEAAARAATATPARALGLDRAGIGALTPGNRADLVILDSDLAVDAVLHNGAWVQRL
ncbi:N-acetylglucosamine-6-phosphate deacetylase [Lipingzhangella halophila]|uniref:N-acetylglucosamine-6-phosphate deacetylase n=1 Tax=Lipingzhangella halophila TaxID=1783352 RepID=A0A7W7RKV8_9ACTN|nr:N-acetylglucosamine-6-phosphate deacetylase [Lipingzhangella halophila]MBB4933844.1 N-acetylglucosamine-6-phosphate deacetylase [Lipingzhangella halophila]